jgi:hypothetical protein
MEWTLIRVPISLAEFRVYIGRYSNQGPWENPPEDEGTRDSDLDQDTIAWESDFSEKMLQHGQQVVEMIGMEDGEIIRDSLNAMVRKKKAQWARVTKEQNELWQTWKSERLASHGLYRRLVDILLSFKSRWLPPVQHPCPTCWEQGPISALDPVKNFSGHVKDRHFYSWGRARDPVSPVFPCALRCEVIMVGKTTLKANVASSGIGNIVTIRNAKINKCWDQGGRRTTSTATRTFWSKPWESGRR